MDPSVVTRVKFSKAYSSLFHISILYCSIGSPPLSAGSPQDRHTENRLLVATRSVTALGAGEGRRGEEGGGGGGRGMGGEKEGGGGREEEGEGEGWEGRGDPDIIPYPNIILVPNTYPDTIVTIPSLS